MNKGSRTDLSLGDGRVAFAFDILGIVETEKTAGWNFMGKSAQESVLSRSGSLWLNQF